MNLTTTTYTPSSSAEENPNYQILVQQRRGTKDIKVLGSLPESIRFDSQSQWEAPLANGILGMMPGAINGLLRMYGVRPATQAMTMQVWQGTEGQDFAVDLVFRTYSDPAQDIRTPLLNLLSFCTPSVDANGVITAPGPRLKPEAASDLVMEAIKSSASVISTIGKLTSTVTTAIGSAIGGGLNSLLDLSGKANASTLDSATQSLAQGASSIPTTSKVADLKKMIENPISIQLGRFLFFDSVVITGVSPEADLSFLDGLTAYPNILRVTVTFRPLFQMTVEDWQNVLIDPGSTSSTASLQSMGSSITSNLASSLISKAGGLLK